MSLDGVQISLEGSLAQHRVGDVRNRIKEHKESLQFAAVEAAAINVQQEMLEQPIENYGPEMQASTDFLEPFSVLWDIVGNFLDAHNRWYKTPLLKQNPEAADKVLLSLPRCPASHARVRSSRDPLWRRARVSRCACV